MGNPRAPRLALASVLLLLACGGGAPPGDASRGLDATGDGPSTLADGAVEDPLELALRTGVPTGITVPALCGMLRATFATARASRLAVWSALYGTDAAGALTAGALTDVTLPFNHDSMVLDNADDERNTPFLLGNAWTGTGAAPGSTLGLAGSAGAWRYAALGTNLLSLVGLSTPAAGSPEARGEQLLAQAVRWLARSSSATGAGLRVVTAHLPDEFYFPHDRGTRAFFARALPEAALTADDSCESAALPGCLAGASLLVLGDDDGNQDDNSHVPLDLAALERALSAAEAQGVPVLFVPYFRKPNAVTELVGRHLRVDFRTNYWDIEAVTRAAATLATQGRTSLERTSAAVDTVCNDALAPADYASCLPGASGAASTLASCAALAFRAKLLEGALALRNVLGAMDARAASPFDAPGYRLLRGMILLGDAYRAGLEGTPALRYPIDWRASAPSFARAVFADSSVHVAHGTNRRQRDLGTYACPRDSVLSAPCQPYASGGVPTPAGDASALVYADTQWTSTGRYALAGVPVRVRRTDHGAATVRVRVGFAREGTTRAFEGSATSTSYDRPQHLASPWVLLEPDREVLLGSVKFSVSMQERREKRRILCKD